MPDDELLHIDTILVATLCAGIARNIATLHYEKLSDEMVQRYSVDVLLRNFGSLESTERALSMMMSYDPTHNRQWMDNLDSMLKSIYNVMARLTEEGHDDQHASDCT